jgi:hypothetical protein
MNFRDVALEHDALSDLRNWAIGRRKEADEGGS